MIRVESITNVGDYIEVSWADEADIDYQSGIIETRHTRIPHEAIPQELIGDVSDCAIQLLEVARVHKHRVADTFTARR
jgi:hypothetical protein